MMRITDTVKHLIIINVILWVGTYLLSTRGIELSDFLALYFPESPNFKIWQVVTHMFMHGSTTHLLFNMLALWMFGTPLEQMWGRNKFLFFYFSAGLGSLILHTAFNYYQFYDGLNALVEAGLSKEDILSTLKAGQYGTNWGNLVGEARVQDMLSSYIVPAVGASGAIYGILVAFAFLFPNAELMMIFLPIPIKAKYFVPIMIALDIFFGFSRYSTGIAHFAHVGGALAGLIMMWYWKKNQFRNNRWDR